MEKQENIVYDSDELKYTSINLSKKQKLAYDLMKNGENLFVTGMAGTGKCLGFNTPIIMYNGEEKMVQNVKKGELIMGDDSTPRTVLSTTNGMDEMYKITLIGSGSCNGRQYGLDDNYIVNSAHILTFQSIKNVNLMDNGMYSLTWGDESGVARRKTFDTKYDVEKYIEKLPDLVDIPLHKCIEKDKMWNNYFHGVYRSIDFKEQPVDVDPYIIGMYLGVGINTWEMAKRPKPSEKIYETLSGSLHIPLSYKANTRKHRLSLLSGIIEHSEIIDINHNCCNFIYSNDSMILAYDIRFVARSLGYTVFVDNQNNLSTITIIGNILDILPVMNTDFELSDQLNRGSFPVKIEKLEKDKYYGFELDGNHRFMLGNFVVTHNTEVLKMFIQENNTTGKIGVTSTTGISALNFGGSTLHSFLGIGLGKGTVEELSKKIKGHFTFKARWVKLETLIIDEVSMLSPVLFDKLEKVARIVRGNDEPFGGIQLILSGDFLQLPVVNSDKFCFESESWKECIPNIVYLTEIMRQKELEFQHCLNSVRVGEVTEEGKELLNSRIGAKLNNEYGIKPTQLYTTNASVDYINNEELDKLAENGVDFYEYDLEIEMTNILKRKKNNTYILNKFVKDCPARESLQLCVGAQVMLLHNLNIAEGLVNGSRGIVTGFKDDIPIVKFLNGMEIMINYHSWELTENKKLLMTVTQIPLRLAYAITGHKSQGSTLDYVEVDLSNCFEYGQAYVMLSRVKSIDGLSIIDIDYNGINAHPMAIEFYLNNVGDSKDSNDSNDSIIGPSINRKKKVGKVRKNALLLLKSDEQKRNESD